ncbi:pyridoxal phosphate-dependent aminotransferase [Ferruginivarius sediminum]|uniref:Aminotransferase n=1 Tax=Ferruginivarius sediminum TaxID=2661937 RepID=A0A369TJC4_9PROT|nr:pyridoxal phosphate-dependent aminotransferase [Ferruginivarius sediminum]RDD62996.1 pyridoxal phosphate-dependent aminotransferase [Ferruginivarius sediminum]
MSNPFDNMYQSFSLFGQARSQKPIHMSAGVNWAEASPTLVSRLKHELDTALTYRNYGRSSGGKILTDIVASVEQQFAGSEEPVSAIFAAGTADASHVVASVLFREGRIREGDRCLAVGLCFPYYYELFTGMGLTYKECVNDERLIPTVDEILADLADVRPSVVVLILPHNPAGCLMTPEAYSRIVKAARDIGAVVFCDRVCLMMWDYDSALLAAFYQGVVDGDVFVFDSLSKSDSLAGLRAGFLLCSPDYHGRIEREIRYRMLNPIVFSTPTIAFARVATLCYAIEPKWSEYFERLVRIYKEALFLEYPSSYGDPFADSDIPGDIDAYIDDQEHLKRRIHSNRDRVEQVVGSRAVKPLVLDGGFNLLLEMDGMRAEREEADQDRLCNDYGVAVLTERCFRATRRDKETYAVRLGLSLDPVEFEAGLDRICQYYGVA